jgi:AcrR family transcriptional regulator
MGRGEKMTENRSATTRSKIMQAAVKCFSAEGYDAASVDDICGAAGVSKGAFYHHFESKQALFLGLLQDWLAGLDQAMQASRKATVPETLLHMSTVMPAMMGSAHGRIGMWLEFWLQATRDKAIWKATIAPYRHYRDFFAELIRQGIAEGSLEPVDPEVAAQAILSMAVGLFLQSVLDPKGTDWEKAAKQSMHMVRAGILRQPGRGSKTGERR